MAGLGAGRLKSELGFSSPFLAGRKSAVFLKDVNCDFITRELKSPDGRSKALRCSYCDGVSPISPVQCLLLFLRILLCANFPHLSQSILVVALAWKKL